MSVCLSPIVWIGLNRVEASNADVRLATAVVANFPIKHPVSDGGLSDHSVFG